MSASRYLLALGFVALCSPAGAATWTHRSPEGARGSYMAKAGNRLLLATTQGLQVSQDEGASWSRLESLPRWRSIGGLIVDPADAEHWFVKYEEPIAYGVIGLPYEYASLVRETRDGGATWQALALPAEALAVPRFHPADARVAMTWYRDANSGAEVRVQSRDGGRSWLPSTSAAAPAPWLGLGISSDHYVGISYVYDGNENTRLAEFRLSSDDTASWSAPLASVLLPWHGDLRLYSRSGATQQVFWIGSGSNLQQTRSGIVDLATGQSQTFPEVPFAQISSIFDDPAHPGQVLALVEPAATPCNLCLRQEIWSLVPGATTWQVRGGISDGSKYTFEGGSLLLLDGTSRQWLSSESSGIFRSDDAGASWSVSNHGLRETKINAVAIDPRDAKVLLAGRDMQSLQRSADGGVSWADVGGQLPRDVRALTRSPLNADHVLATADDGLYRSLDAGQSWQRVATAIDPVVAAKGWSDLVWCANNDTHLLAAVGSDLYRSVDAGLNWSVVAQAEAGRFTLESARLQPGRTYIMSGLSSNFLSSDDCGLTQQSLGAAGGSIRTISVDPRNAAHVVAGGSFFGTPAPTLKQSLDGGATWTPLPHTGWVPRRGGWIDACDSARFTTHNLHTLRAGSDEVRLEPPFVQTSSAGVRASDSQCIGGESVSAIGTGAGIWLRRAAADSVFADGLE